jgi:Beta-galactosidase
LNLWVFCYGLVLVAFAVLPSAGLARSPQPQAKIFSLQRPDKDPHQALPELDNPLVYGLSWRFRWRTIEPEDGHYNWTPIDQAVGVTGKAGKKIMLRVVAGINSPEWVYQSGAQAFDFSHTDLAHPRHYSANLRMPIPWDEVYLKRWEEFIRAFGKRYNGNAQMYSIQMAGGGHIGEMNLPKAYQKWQRAGYTDQKLINAWKHIIDAYQKALPDTPTNLDINEPLGKQSDVLQPIVTYVLTTYPRKVYLQHNGLKADFPKGDRIRQIIREASRKTIVGYQMVGGKGFLEGPTGNRMEAFHNALEDHAGYVEVYASDVVDPMQQRALKFLANP